MYQQVLKFWFEEIEQKKWWAKDPQFDQLIRERFYDLHQQANRCELFGWRVSAEGCLAEILVLDQFSRNIYRDKAAAFASDPLALALAQEAIAKGVDASLTPIQKSFLYLPYMHSESRQIHKTAVALYEQNGLANNLDFELRHKAIIDRFGRYPHRNSILGRESSAAEIEFLLEPGSSF